MSELHTKGRITFKEDDDANHYSMLTEDGRWWLAVLANGEQTGARQIANFRRLAACWNACEGIETEWLEKYPTGFESLVGNSELVKQRDQLQARIAELESAWQAQTLNRKDQIIEQQERHNDELKARIAELEAERDRNERLFVAACTDLGQINQRLGLDPNDGGSAPIIAAIDRLQQLVDSQVQDIGNGMAVLHRVRKERNELLDWMRHIHGSATDIGVERKAIAMAASKAIAVVEGSQCQDCQQPTSAQPVAVPDEWPKERDVGRIGDMSKVAHLRVGLDSDNDVYVSVWGEDAGGAVEFCAPGSGGGKSPRTRAALISLMVAMEADNTELPARDWWAARESAAQQQEGV